MPTADLHLASRKGQESRVKSPARVRMIARQVHAWPHGHGWTVRQQALSRFTHPGRGCHARSVDAVESIRSHIRSLRYESRHHIRSRLSHAPIALSRSGPDPVQIVHMSATEIEETPLVVSVVVSDSAAMGTGIGKRKPFTSFFCIAHLQTR
jgi:hypothetical protein